MEEGVIKANAKKGLGVLVAVGIVSATAVLLVYLGNYGWSVYRSVTINAASD